jgi:hypothetical protein
MTTGDKGGKERKRELSDQKLITCNHCPYHDQENFGRRAKDDRYKAKRRGRKGA